MASFQHSVTTKYVLSFQQDLDPECILFSSKWAGFCGPRLGRGDESHWRQRRRGPHDATDANYSQLPPTSQVIAVFFFFFL